MSTQCKMLCVLCPRRHFDTSMSGIEYAYLFTKIISTNIQARDIIEYKELNCKKTTALPDKQPKVKNQLGCIAVSSRSTCNLQHCIDNTCFYTLRTLQMVAVRLIFSILFTNDKRRQVSSEPCGAFSLIHVLAN